MKLIPVRSSKTQENERTDDLPVLSAQWARVALLLLIALITYWLLVPSPPGHLTDFEAPLKIRSDWLLHGFVYATVTFFLISCQSARYRIWGVSLSLLHAAATETLQFCIPTRHFDTSDMLANGGGLIMGVIIWGLYRVCTTQLDWRKRLLPVRRAL